MNPTTEAEQVEVPPGHTLPPLPERTGHGSITEVVTDALREAIVSGALTPGTRLREAQLAETWAVSRTPVRDALMRIADEGLTIRSANRGSVVATVTPDEIFGVYDVRAALEGLAARTAAARRPPGLVDELVRIHSRFQAARGDSVRLAATNLEFHRAIRRAAGHAYLDRFLGQLENAVRRFGPSTFATQGRPDAAELEHQAIIDAIAVGDEDEAEASAVEHMRHAQRVRMEWLTRTPPD